MRAKCVAMESYNAQHIEDLRCDTTFPQIEFRLIYLPAYFCSYPYKDKTYNIYINGQTGTVKGTIETTLIYRFLFGLTYCCLFRSKTVWSRTKHGQRISKVGIFVQEGVLKELPRLFSLNVHRN